MSRSEAQPELSRLESAILDRIDKHLGQLDESGDSERLGVPLDANQGDIKSALEDVASNFHPDQFKKYPSPIPERARMRFELLQEAGLRLLDSAPPGEARAKIEGTPQGATPTPARSATRPKSQSNLQPPSTPPPSIAPPHPSTATPLPMPLPPGGLPSLGAPPQSVAYSVGPISQAALYDTTGGYPRPPMPQRPSGPALGQLTGQVLNAVKQWAEAADARIAELTAQNQVLAQQLDAAHRHAGDAERRLREVEARLHNIEQGRPPYR